MININNLIKEYHIKNIICCWSGGRSSLAMTHYVMTSTENIDINKHVAFVDTGIMLPEAIDFVKNVSEKYEWKLHIIKPETDFWSYARRYGTPAPKRRWCCKILKLKPLFTFSKTLEPERLMCLGFRKDEKRRERRMLPEIFYQKPSKSWILLPIRNWTTSDVRKYIKQHNLPEPPWYSKGIKECCVCGAYMSKKTLYAIKTHYPGIFRKFIELDKERRTKWGRTAFYQNGKPVDLEDISKQITILDYM